jgi:hypothetical protein
VAFVRVAILLTVEPLPETGFGKQKCRSPTEIVDGSWRCETRVLLSC